MKASNDYRWVNQNNFYRSIKNIDLEMYEMPNYVNKGAVDQWPVGKFEPILHDLELSLVSLKEQYINIFLVFNFAFKLYTHKVQVSTGRSLKHAQSKMSRYACLPHRTLDTEEFLWKMVVVVG
jgi:hypothetical protein